MRYRDFLPEDKPTTLDLPTLEVGDKVLVGKFKNRKAVIKGFDTDKHNQPVLKTDKGEQKLFKPRLVKLMTERIDQIDGAGFRAWFKDSKVVDATGQPRIVYHGTSRRFQSFNIKKSTMGIIWFTSDKDSIVSGSAGAQGTDHILELYASIQNPAGWRAYDKLLLAQFKSEGYDGAILPNRDGHFDGFVFDPSQLKSATHNRGTFDPHDSQLRR